MSAAHIPTGISNTSSNFIDRRAAGSMTDGILHNVRQQKAADRAASRRAADIETASVNSDAATLCGAEASAPQAKDRTPPKPRNGTTFDEKKLKDQALKSQMRFSM